MGKAKRRAHHLPAQHSGKQPAVAQREVLFTASRTSFSGPLPPPEVLQHYASVFEGCAERIVTMAERQSDHRRELEAKVVNGNVGAQTRGQVLGFILATIVLVGSFYLIGIDKDAVGISLIIGDVATLLGVFMYGRGQQRRERVEKDRNIQGAVGAQRR